MIFSKYPKSHQVFGLLLKDNLSPRNFKNCPIWSYWFTLEPSWFFIYFNNIKLLHIRAVTSLLEKAKDKRQRGRDWPTLIKTPFLAAPINLSRRYQWRNNGSMPEGVLTLGYQFFRKSLFRTLIPMPDCQMTGEAYASLMVCSFFYVMSFGNRAFIFLIRPTLASFSFIFVSSNTHYNCYNK